MSGLTLRSIQAWPLWTLRDSQLPEIRELRRADVLTIISMMMVGLEVVQPGEIPLEQPISPDSAFTLAEVCRQFGLSRDTVERAARRLRGLGLLEQVQRRDGAFVRRLTLPSPPKPAPVARVDIAPLRWIGESPISDTAKLAMVTLWTYRSSHLVTKADVKEIVYPSVARLAAACRCSRRHFYNDHNEAAYRSKGVFDELKEAGWVTDEGEIPGGVVRRGVLVKPYEKKRSVARGGTVLLELYDQHRVETATPALTRTPGVLRQAERMNEWFNSTSVSPEDYFAWLLTNFQHGPGDCIFWDDVSSPETCQRHVDWVKQKRAELRAKVIPIDTKRRKKAPSED